MVASPYSKPHGVTNVVHDHTSVLATTEAKWNLPAMTYRDANAWPMLDMFDFDKPPFVVPPRGAPATDPDPAGVKWCKDNPPGTGLP